MVTMLDARGIKMIERFRHYKKLQGDIDE